jgi:Gas vesicle protein K
MSSGWESQDPARPDTPARRRINADPESVERGLVSLVLTIVELLRQLMERQALRRVDQGSLTDEQVEQIGWTLMSLESRMAELRDHFGLAPEDLNLDLGPLGPLLPHDLSGRRVSQAGAVAAGCPILLAGDRTNARPGLGWLSRVVRIPGGADPEPGSDGALPATRTRCLAGEQEGSG